MKKTIQKSPILTLLIAVVFSVFYGCEKNPMDNFKITVSPALFEYTASIRIIDAADSTVPPNLKIVLDPENEGDLYDILGKNKLVISDNGFIQVGLKPSMKPDANNPVEIRFQLQADNYISESFSLVYYLGQYSVNKTFTLMNKSNLPRGVSYTEVTAAMSNGLITKDLNINLGGGQGGMTLKRAVANDVNKITFKAGTKFIYWEFDRSQDRYVFTEVFDSGQLKVYAYFNQGLLIGESCYKVFRTGYIDDKGTIQTIPANSGIYGVGGWKFHFVLNGRQVYPQYDGDKNITLELSLPKSGFNLKTGTLYQKGDVINIYNYVWGDHGLTFNLLSSETLSETSDLNPDYFKLKNIHVNYLNNIMIGEILPVVTFDKSPVIKLQGDNTPPDYSNPYIPVYQYLTKEFKINNQTYRYGFGQYSSSLNQPEYEGFEDRLFIPGTYTKQIVYPDSKVKINSVNTSLNWNYVHGPDFIKSVVVSQGGPNPFDETIPSDKMQRTDISFSVKCGDQIIQPSFSFMVRQVPTWGYWFEGGYISNGSGASYLLKVGGAYEFMINFEGKDYTVIDTIKSSKIAIVIEDDSFCTF